jgi:photosystem II stability/assembly factor-like uncharacterized protein
MNTNPWIAFRRGIVAAVLAAGAAIVAAENVWTSQGPADLGATIDLVIVDSTAYAGTWNGVFRSDDGGVHWKQAGLEGVFVRRVDAAPGGAVIFATTPEGELYGSRDGGGSWARVLEHLELVRDVAIDPFAPSTVYVGTSDGEILRSTDSGASWTEFSIVPHDIHEFLLDREAMYILAFGEVLKSVDGGLTWENVAVPLRYAAAIAGGGLAGVVYLGGDQKFCKSSDAAATWTCSDLPSYPLRILEIPGDAAAPPSLFVSSGQGLLRSLDGGASWEPVAGAPGTSTVAGPAADSAGSLILAGGDGGVFRSTSRGDSWEYSSDGFVAYLVSALAVDPANSSTLWAGVYANARRPALIHSTDSGQSWSPVDASPNPIDVSRLLIDPRDSSRMYATMYVDSETGIYRSEDAGRTWTASPRVDEYLGFLELDPHEPDRLWKLSSPSGNLIAPWNLSRSDDGARSFSAVSTLAQGVYSLVFDGRRPGTIYAGSYFELGDGWYAYPEGGSIFVSRDAGMTWSQNPTDFGGAVSAIATDPFEDDILFLGTSGGGLYRSFDDGASWTRAGLIRLNAAVSTLVADPARSGHLYAVTDTGVFRSTDRAGTWHPFSTGLPPELSVTSLVITPDGKRLHAGTYGGGIYKRDLEGTSECSASGSRLCLAGGRYAVDLFAGRLGQPPTTPGTARVLADRAGYFSLPFATGDAGLPEVVVKVLGQGALGLDGSPIFYSSLTTLPYILAVTDTLTGDTQAYHSDAAHPLCGAVDVAFEPQAATAPVWRAAAESETALPLLNGRFSVSLEARHASTGARSAGRAIASSDRYGFFTLPAFTLDPTLPEVIVKMLDFRSTTGNFLFFYTGLTHLDYTLTVTDTWTGATRTFQGPADYCGAVESLEEPTPTDLGGTWWGTVSFPTNCLSDCPPVENVRADLSQFRNVVDGELSTQCLGTLAVNGILEGNRLTLNVGSADLVGEATPRRIRASAAYCNPWNYDGGNFMTLKLDRSP